MKKIMLTMAAVLAALGNIAYAETYPTRTISMIVPYAAGGSTDALARVMASAMGRQLNQSIIVENVGGGGGIIGIQKLVKAKPDGYTISLGNMGNFAIAGTLYPNAHYDPRKDVKPIGLVANVPMVLSASKKSGINTMAEFLQKLHSSDTAVNFANSGPGSTGHIGAAYFLTVSKTKAVQIYYRGAGPAIVDLMSGTVDAVVDQTVTMIPASKGGRVVPLAVSGDARLDQLPGVPTFKEAGVPEFDLQVWNAIVAPKETPDAIINQLAVAITNAFNDPKVIEQMKLFAAPIPAKSEQGPLALKALIEKDVLRFAKLIKDAKIEVDN